jgi:NDP-hexose C3-ketoreductase / dTDP-4-oxo-2-deoxy-alpha-D-pentos-2-ene 2,3-reductase
MERRLELEVIPACIAYGVGVIVWSPLAGGLLAGPATGRQGRRASDSTQATRLARAAQLDAFQSVCDDIGLPPSLVALAWLLHQAGITSAIIGPADLEQLTTLLAASAVTLETSVLEQLDGIFPPCGRAPEAYAW